MLELFSLTFQKLLIRFPIRVSSEHLLKLVLPVLCTLGLLTWFADYLSGRMQRIVLNGHSSQVTKVSSGVPQGSILGPLLFSIYQLCNIPLSATSKIQLYADDILLHKPIGRDSTSDVANLQSDINSVAVAVSELPGYPGRRHARRALGLWVEKNPAPPPNRRALDLPSENSAPSSRKTI